jgi:hypothetical protein
LVIVRLLYHTSDRTTVFKGIQLTSKQGRSASEILYQGCGDDVTAGSHRSLVYFNRTPVASCSGTRSWTNVGAAAQGRTTEYTKHREKGNRLWFVASNRREFATLAGEVLPGGIRCREGTGHAE